MSRYFQYGRLTIHTATRMHLLLTLAVTAGLALAAFFGAGGGQPNSGALPLLRDALIFGVCAVAFVLYHSGKWTLDSVGIVWEPFLRHRQILRWDQVHDIRRPKDNVRVVMSEWREIRIARHVLSRGDMAAFDDFIAHHWPAPPPEATVAIPVHPKRISRPEVTKPTPVATVKTNIEAHAQDLGLHEESVRKNIETHFKKLPPDDCFTTVRTVEFMHIPQESDRKNRDAETTNPTAPNQGKTSVTEIRVNPNTVIRETISTSMPSHHSTDTSSDRKLLAKAIFPLFIPLAAGLVDLVVHIFLEPSYPQLHSSFLSLPGLVGAILSLSLLPGLRWSFGNWPRALGMLAIMMFIFLNLGDDLGVLINGTFDHSTPFTRTATIFEKHIDYGSPYVLGHRFGWVAGARFDDHPDETVNLMIKKAEYKAVRPGVSTVTLTLHKGALGYPWLASQHVNIAGTPTQQATAAP